MRDTRRSNLTLALKSAAPPASAGPARRGPGLLPSKKVDCKARFAVQILGDGNALIKYLRVEHVDACRVQAVRLLSPGVRAEMHHLAVQQPNISAFQLVQQVTNRVLNDYCAVTGLGREAALALFDRARHAVAFPSRISLLRPQEPSAAPRDYWVSETDAWNVISEVQNHTWKMADNIVDSVQLWVQANAGDVARYEPQQAECVDGVWKARAFMYCEFASHNVPRKSGRFCLC